LHINRDPVSRHIPRTYLLCDNPESVLYSRPRYPRGRSPHAPSCYVSQLTTRKASILPCGRRRPRSPARPYGWGSRLTMQPVRCLMACLVPTFLLLDVCILTSEQRRTVHKADASIVGRGEAPDYRRLSKIPQHCRETRAKSLP
jgi:hypothetical protein